MFYVTTLNLARFLKDDPPIVREDGTDVQVLHVVDAWKHSNFLCQNYVLNDLSDTLSGVYTT